MRMDADHWSAVFVPLSATQEWGEDRGEGVSLVAAGSEQQKNIQHRTSNIQLPTGHCLAPYLMFGVGCWLFCRLGLELAVASSGKPVNVAACPINRCKSWPSRAVCIEGRSRAPLCCMSPN